MTCSCCMSKHRPELSARMRMRPTPSAAERDTSDIARRRSRGRIMFPLATMVTCPTSPVSMDLGGGGSVCPESAASAAARTSLSVRPSSPPFLTASRIFSAVGVKYGRSSSSTNPSSMDACSAEEVMTSAPVGGVMTLKLTPVSRVMVRILDFSLGVYMAIAEPFLLARPVRPHLCTKDSVSCGSS